MSELVILEGTSKWAKVFESNRDPGGTDSNGNVYPEATTIELILDQDELKKLSTAYPRVKPKIGDDGMFVKIRRQWSNPIADRGGAPRVTDAEGNLMDGSVLIGDGSKVQVVVEVYPTKHGGAMRLAAVKVLELVEYEGEGDIQPVELPEGF